MRKRVESISFFTILLLCVGMTMSANAQPLSGVYTIQQVSNDRFVDAHESNSNPTNDFSLVTRTAQNNDTQRWRFTPLGNDVYMIQQVSNDRFVDAHESDSNPTNDFSLVTRTIQGNDTQQWRLTALGNDVYTIQQVSTDRFVDAHESDANATNDFTLVTRTAQNNDTQRWRILSAEGGRLLNISTNGPVDQRGMIAGFLVEERGEFAILAESEGPNPIQDAVLTVAEFNATTGLFETIAQNDNWDSLDGAAFLEIIGREPGRATDAGMVIFLEVGAYTATITGKGGGTGTGIIAVTKR